MKRGKAEVPSLRMERWGGRWESVERQWAWRAGHAACDRRESGREGRWGSQSRKEEAGVGGS